MPTIVHERDAETWEEEVRKAQEALRNVGKSGSRRVISFIVNVFAFYTHTDAYDTKTYHPLRDEVLMQIILHPRDTIYSLAKHVCEEQGYGVKSKIVRDMHSEIMNSRLIPKKPLCMVMKCYNEPRQPMRVYPTIFLAKYIQQIAKGGLKESMEKILECVRITARDRVLLIADDRELYSNKWHYPCDYVGEDDKLEGDAARRVAKRLFEADLTLESPIHERPSMQRLPFGEFLWHKIFGGSFSRKPRFRASSTPLKWWTEQDIRNDLNNDEHKIDDVHSSIELRIRALERERLDAWRERGGPPSS